MRRHSCASSVADRFAPRQHAAEGVSAMAISKCAWLWGAFVLLVACGDSSGGEGGGPSQSGDAAIGEVFLRCPSDTPVFVAGLVADGETGVVNARLIDASALPPQKYRNDWTIEFTSEEGTPLDDVDLAVDDVLAKMPGHSHVNSPRAVNALPEPGRYELEYLNLFMRGPWEIEIMAASESAGSDRLVFRVCVVDD
jgi:hypothetical protein